MKGYTSVLGGDDFKEGSVVVPYVRDVLGDRGTSIRTIQDHCGVKIYIPEPAPKDEGKPRRIFIAGPKDKVGMAKELIKELTKYFHTSVTHPGLVHVEMDVPTHLYNYIIGSRGSEVKHIQGNFKVSVHIPQELSVNKNVVIVGSKEGVEKAQRYIQQKIIDQAGKDDAAASQVASAWAAGARGGIVEEEEVQEPWMEQYTHPSKRTVNNVESVVSVSVPPPHSLPSVQLLQVCHLLLL